MTDEQSCMIIFVLYDILALTFAANHFILGKVDYVSFFDDSHIS